LTIHDPLSKFIYQVIGSGLGIPMRGSVGQAVEQCYEAVGDVVAWEAALHALAVALGAHGAVLLPLEVTSIDFPLVPSRELAEPAAAYVSQGWTSLDFRATRAGRQFGKGVLFEEHVSTPDERARSPYFQDFMRPHGLTWWAGVMCSDGSERWCLAILRRDGQERFDQRDAARLRQLAPHLNRILRLARSASVAGFSRLAERSFSEDSAVFPLDRRGKLVLPAANILRGRWAEVVTVIGDKLCARHQASDIALQAALLRTLQGRPIAPAETVVLKVPDGSAAVLAWFDLVVGSGTFPGADVTRVLLNLRDPWHRRKISDVALKALGLTPFEARVAGAVSTGCSPAETALTMDTTVGTVRSVLHSIYDKLGIRGQVELANLLAQLPKAASSPIR